MKSFIFLFPILFMRIAYLCDVVYPWVKGGSERRNYEILTRISKKISSHIFTMKWWKGKARLKTGNVYIHGVSNPPKSIYRGRRRSIKSALSYSIHILFNLSKYRFDFVECSQSPFIHTIPAKIFSLIRGIPLIFTWHEVWNNYWLKYLGPIGYFAKILERIILHFPKKIIAVSEKTKHDLLGIGIRKNKIVVIPNGIDLNLIRKIKPAKEKFDIIFVGRLVENKNVNFLLRSVAHLKKVKPKIKVAIIGDGPERIKLEKLSIKLGIKENLTFFGFLERYEDVIALMKSSKVFAFPSTREGFSIVCLEALACGLPVVAIRGQLGIKIREGIDGFLTKFDESEFAKKILDAMSLKPINYKYIYEYDWNEIAKKYEKMLTSEIIK